jgi:hypothetical protein
MEVGISGERNMTVMGGSGFFASDALSGFFHSSNAESGFNWSKIKYPQLDALLDEALEGIHHALGRGARRSAAPFR